MASHFIPLKAQADDAAGCGRTTLRVSRPFLIKLLEHGEDIPFHRTGTHRRIDLRDLIDYKNSSRMPQPGKSLDELARSAQELGIYDE